MIENIPLKYLHYNLYCDGNVGICNLILSVENALVIAALTNTRIKFYGDEYIDNHSRNPYHPKAKIFDLITIKYPHDIIDNNNIDSNIPSLPFSTYDDCVFYHNDIPPEDFLDGRKNICDLALFENLDNIRTKDKGTLGLYSYLFYLNDEKRKTINDLIFNSIIPKKKYIDICNNVIRENNLVNYNCMHLRRGDFCYHKVDIYPCFNLDKFYYGIEKNFDKNETLLIATDESNKDFFKLLKDNYPKTIFINDLLEKYNICDVEKGMVTILIASYSKNFIGMFESTFTGYIQRRRIYNGFNEPFKFLFSRESDRELDENQCFIFNKPGKYSWNRINDITKSHSKASFYWKREWPECFN